jgi:hypothetical protein
MNFIIGKQRIYDRIFSLIEESAKLLLLLCIISFAVSLFVASIIYVRYRTISKLAAKRVLAAEEGERIPRLSADSFIIQELGTDKAAVYRDHDRGEKPEILEDQIELSEIPTRILYDEKSKIDTSRTIKDAIPVKKEG